MTKESLPHAGWIPTSPTEQASRGSIIGPQGHYDSTHLLPPYNGSRTERKGFETERIIQTADDLAAVLANFQTQISKDPNYQRWGMRFICNKTVLLDGASDERVKPLMKEYFEGALSLEGAEHTVSAVNEACVVYLGYSSAARYSPEKADNDKQELEKAFTKHNQDYLGERKEGDLQKDHTQALEIGKTLDRYQFQLLSPANKAAKREALMKALNQYGASEEEKEFICASPDVQVLTLWDGNEIVSFVCLESAEIRVGGISINMVEFSGSWSKKDTDGKPLRGANAYLTHMAYGHLASPQDSPHLVYGESHLGQAVVPNALRAGRTADTESIAAIYEITRPCVLRGDYTTVGADGAKKSDSYVPMGMTRELLTAVYRPQPTAPSESS